MDFYATLGPSCASQETLCSMFRLGMTGARLNLSHVGLADCAPMLEDFHAAAQAAGVVPKLVIDLQGPEERVGSLREPLRLEEHAVVRLGEDIPVSERILALVEPGDKISLDDSALLLEAEHSGQYKVLQGGILYSKKSLAVLGKATNAPALTPEDLRNLDQAAAFGVTGLLQPFVRGREDIEEVRNALECRSLSHISIMAKIENRQGLEKLEEIIEAADEICIARGDLGNAIPLWELPRIQKQIASVCVKAVKPFCLATQLLWSMQERPVPTRAEVCDIYNGVLDGASGLMLTGETAVGRCPKRAMEFLVKTAKTAG